MHGGSPEGYFEFLMGQDCSLPLGPRWNQWPDRIA